MKKNYLLGMAVGSVITAIVLYVPFSGLFGQFFIPGLLGILVALALVVPGAVVAGLIARGRRRGAEVGAVTALLGYVVLLIAVPELRPPGPFLLFVMVWLSPIFLMVAGMAAGGIAGKMRTKKE